MDPKVLGRFDVRRVWDEPGPKVGDCVEMTPRSPSLVVEKQPAAWCSVGMTEPPSAPKEMPDPSAELVLIRVLVEAHLSMLSRKKGERYLRTVSAKLADEESLSSVFNIRPDTQREAVNRARRQAATMFERLLPLFAARLPEA